MFGPVRVSGVRVCVHDQRRRVCLKCVFTVRVYLCVCVFIVLLCMNINCE